jgi:hypothetical protein
MVDLGYLPVSVEDLDGVVADVRLSLDYPDPFSKESKICFSLPFSGKVRIHVYDVLGRIVGQLINRVLPAGHHEIVCDACGLASGVFVDRLTTPRWTRSETASLLR